MGKRSRLYFRCSLQALRPKCCAAARRPVGRCSSDASEITGGLQELTMRPRSPVFPLLVAGGMRPLPVPVVWHRQSARRSFDKIYSRGNDPVNTFFRPRGQAPAVTLATPRRVGIAGRATRAWRNGRPNGLEAFECAAGNRGRRTAQTRGNLSTAIPSQARQREGVETRRAAPKPQRSMIPKSGNRFSEMIMLQQKGRAGRRHPILPGQGEGIVQTTNAPKRGTREGGAAKSVA